MTPTTVLAIDTSTKLLSVALKTEKGWIESSSDIALKHAELVMDFVEFCIKRSTVSRSEIGLVVSTLGPGSFTGLRIGMAASKGIAAGLGVPWTAVPSLDVLAWGYDYYPGAIAPIIDGKKGRVYTAIYERGRRASEYLDIPLAKLAQLLDTYPNALVTGPDAELFRDLALERAGFQIDSRGAFPSARALACLGQELYLREGPRSTEEGPLYLRPSEAEEPR